MKKPGYFKSAASFAFLEEASRLSRSRELSAGLIHGVCSQENFMHLLIDEVLAAPERGFPSLLTAFASQADMDCADAGAVIEPIANKDTNTAAAMSSSNPQEA